MSFRKALISLVERGDPVSSEKPLPVHCSNGVMAMRLQPDNKQAHGVALSKAAERAGIEHVE